ncbi:hypothetical protein NQ318_023129, partial [Aromia moschata]
MKSWVNCICKVCGLKSTSEEEDSKYDVDDSQDEPPSPAHSHTSSTHAYSNLPSPSYDSQLMPPPAVNRDLKPKRKLSDSHSISSNPEPPFSQERSLGRQEIEASDSFT